MFRFEPTAALFRIILSTTHHLAGAQSWSLLLHKLMKRNNRFANHSGQVLKSSLMK
jgi:hypothetical protein